MKKYFLPLLAIALIAAACGEPEEAPRITAPVVMDDSGLKTVTNDLGYEITIDSVRIAIEDLHFTVAGEEHMAMKGLHFLSDLIPTAHAHPGHSYGGIVTGELKGALLLSWPASEETSELGQGTLLPGNYTAADFTFSRGSADHGLEADDELMDHTAVLKGVATRDEESVDFTIIVDSPVGRELIGAPFEASVTKDFDKTIGFRFHPEDPYEGNIIFEGLDFFELPQETEGQVLIAPGIEEVESAYNRFVRRFQAHDYYDLIVL